MIKPAMAKPEGIESMEIPFSESPPVHRRMEEEYVQEHILTDSIVAPVGGCLTSSRCLAIGPYTFNEVRCIRPILLNRKNALFAGLGSTNDKSRQLTAVTGADARASARLFMALLGAFRAALGIFVPR